MNSELYFLQSFIGDKVAISEYLHGIREKIGNDLLIMPSVTGVVWNTEDQLLLLRQYQDGPWTLPGGIVDPGEFPAQALLREVWEETGQIAYPKRIIAVFGGADGFKRTYANGHQVEFVDTVFECRATGGGKLACQDDEGHEVRYFARKELTGLPWAYPIKVDVLLSDVETLLFTWKQDWISEMCSKVL
jgi:8-oxo-dGTP pyrophosphatase MutT (NUDIX family)